LSYKHVALAERVEVVAQVGGAAAVVDAQLQHISLIRDHR
jgi:hypothetical protein